MAANACRKFGLLLWKNWLLELRHKWVLFFEIVLPLLFCGCLLLIRHFMEAVKVPEATKFESFSPINHVPFNISFAPDKPAVRRIVEAACSHLELAGELIGFESNEVMVRNITEGEDTVGIAFTDNFPPDGNYPMDLKFSLRFPSEMTNCSDKWETDYLFPFMEYNRPRDLGNNKGPPCTYDSGFLTLQSLLSRSFIELKSNKALPGVQLKRFPYPPYVKDEFLPAVGGTISLFILLCFVSPFGVLVKQITGEKEHQHKEIMRMMGVSNWLHWLAWFTKSITFLSIICAIAVIMFKIPLHSELVVRIFVHSDWAVLFLVLFVYSIATTAFAIMTAVFFSKSNTAQAVGTVLFFAVFIPFYAIEHHYFAVTVGRKIGVSFLSNTAMALCFKLIIKLEGSAVGLQWSNIFEPVTIDEDISVGVLMLIMLFDAVIYMLIGFYVERIFPGEYGVPEPWYFPFTTRFWCGNYPDNIYKAHSFAEMHNAHNFEAGPTDKRPGIRIRSLRKVYGQSKVAVTGLSMDMYEDQITALLGHNGAGKTTTMSMLMGLFPPTCGTAIINGSDIRFNITGVRLSLGVCPQRNVIFGDLTVGEHLRFYCSLKGLNKVQTQREVTKYLRLLDLTRKENSLSSHLSGGMKRKLCTAIALCGFSKVVLLDEPTSGMDPAARRNLWNLLQQEKKGRTILLSTHHMDEADILGDRIAILSHGELKACGSSFFLKKRFGVGYHLVCEKGQRCNSYNITKLLQKYNRKISVESNIGSELSYKLPEESVSIFERMLKDLENNSETLHISGYGISPTTLEEVFMRVEADVYNESKLEKQEQSHRFSFDEKDAEAFNLTDLYLDSWMLVKGPRLYAAQWVAMFTKKYYYATRNWIMLLIHLVIPVGILILADQSLRSNKRVVNLPSLKMDLTSYGSTTSILQRSFESKPMMEFQNEYERLFNTFEVNTRLKVVDGDFEDYLLEQGKAIQPEINKRYMVATSTNADNITASFNNQAYHTGPLALNLVYNALARLFLDTSHTIEVVNHPLPFTTDYVKTKMVGGGSVSIILSFYITFAMCFVSAYFILRAIKERISRAKLLQFVSGVDIFTFWTTTFLWDLLVFLGIISIVTVTLAILKPDGAETSAQIGRLFFVMLLFACSSLPLTYVFSFAFSDSATGYGKVSIIYIFLGPAAFMVSAILHDIVPHIVWYFRFVPHFCISNAVSNLLFVSHVCENIGPSPFVDCSKDYFSISDSGVGIDVLFFIFDGVLYTAILLLIEYGVFNECAYKIIRKCRRHNYGISLMHTATIDDDVLAEKNLIKKMSLTQMKSKNLVLKDVSKYYKNFLAVNKLSVAVQQAECFGLLGINGAGKTSTFKMLTGDENISSGDIYVKGVDLRKNMSTVFKHIGYCPQFDGLSEDLSGRETMEIFCLLRGVPNIKIRSVTTHLSKSLGFFEHIDKRITEYSGGTKRKLSTALALIGGPEIIYLDEPTTGMDPKSRRKLWNVLCKIRDSGKTIVLTSHSMEECEALCTRLAIMVNGEFKCIGSRQHLKNKFSKGLLLIIKMKRLNEEVNEDNSHMNGYGTGATRGNAYAAQRMRQLPEGPGVTDFTRAVGKVKEFVSSHFTGAVLKDEYKELLTFFIPHTSIKWSKIFGLMQSNKLVLQIEDYSVSQTTLEQIFLDFAKNQVFKS